MTLKCSTATANACLKILNLYKTKWFLSVSSILMQYSSILNTFIINIFCIVLKQLLHKRAATTTSDKIYRKYRTASRLLYFIQHLPGYVSVTSKKEERRDTWSKSDKSVIQTFIKIIHCPVLAHYLSPPNHISTLFQTLQTTPNSRPTEQSPTCRTRGFGER